jgi:hypothetical protein
MTTKAQLAEQQEAIKQLKEDYGIKPGTKIFTKVTHVSRSGMSRSIEAYLALIDDKGVPGITNISWLLAKAGLGTFDRTNGGVKMGGCGMDMTFALVYNLGRTLFPEGFETWEGYYRNEPLKFDTDGGYALKNVNI